MNSTKQSSPRPGIVDAPRPFSLLVIALILVMGGIICWLFGTVQREGLGKLLAPVAATPLSSAMLKDTHGGVLLVYEQKGNSGQVTAIKTGQASRLLISDTDATATGASLAPNGQIAAYVSAEQNGQVIIVSLVDDRRFKIDESNLQNAHPVAKSELMTICPWTTTSWDIYGQRVAFFGCSQRRPYSVLVVATMPTATLTLTTTGESGSADPRQALWLNPWQIVVTTPISGVQGSTTVQTISAP